MIKINNASLLYKKKEIKDINESFSTGATYLPYEKKYLYSLLTLKDVSLSSGNIIIDDIDISNISDNSPSSLFCLGINSKVIDLSTCFIIPNENKKGIIEAVQSSLYSLKDLPLNKLEEKRNKIRYIFNILVSYKVSYLLIDMNDNINKENEILIEEIKNEYLDKLTFIILSKKEEKEEEIDNFAAIEIKQEKEIKKDKVTSKQYLKAYKALYKYNKSFYLFSLFVFSLTSAFAFALIPVIYQKITSIIICVSLGVIIPLIISCLTIYRIFDFMDKKDKPNMDIFIKVGQVSIFIYMLVSILLGVGLMSLISYFKILFPLKEYQLWYLFPLGITTLIMILTIIFIKPLRKIVNKLKKKRKSPKKDL